MQNARQGRSLVRIGIPLLVASLIGGVIAWLNGTPWWGWLILGLIVVASGAAARFWLGRRWFVRTGAWFLVAAFVAGAAFVLAPIPVTRTLNGPLTDPVNTAEGEIVGVRNEQANVDAFAGIPYAAPPVGPLRWQPPAPAPKRDSVLVADDFGPSAVQPGSSFLTRALTRVIDVPPKRPSSRATERTRTACGSTSGDRRRRRQPTRSPSSYTCTAVPSLGGPARSPPTTARLSHLAVT